jgi:putative transposase
MPYCRLFYHFVWATKNRQSVITPEVEIILYNAIQSKAVGLGGRLFIVNACRDHIHMVVSIPPDIPVSRFIGQIKGISALKVNKAKVISEHFQWQDAYAVFSVDESGLPACMTYVQRQKEHHNEGGMIELRWE